MGACNSRGTSMSSSTTYSAFLDTLMLNTLPPELVPEHILGDAYYYVAPIHLDEEIGVVDGAFREIWSKLNEELSEWGCEACSGPDLGVVAETLKSEFPASYQPLIDLILSAVDCEMPRPSTTERSSTQIYA